MGLLPLRRAEPLFSATGSEPRRSSEGLGDQRVMYLLRGGNAIGPMPLSRTERTNHLTKRKNIRQMAMAMNLPMKAACTGQ